MSDLMEMSDLTTDAKAWDLAHVLYPWAVQSQVRPTVIERAEGCRLWDSDGNEYLDFASQLVNVSIGHQHPKVVEAIRNQAAQLCTIGPNMATRPRAELAHQIAQVTPGRLTMSFFTNGGAEANEYAVRLARAYTGRRKVIARYRSYHGGTAAAMSLTGEPRRWGAEPGIPGVVHILDPYTYRCPAGHPDPCPVCSGGPHLEEILQYENPGDVAAVIMEPIAGTNGIIVPPEEYLPSVREVCDRYGILLIADEVMTGFGRTGKWFGVDNWAVVPDIMTVAKGINSGYVPLGAMVVSERVGTWAKDNFFPGGLTYSGHPLACAAAVASIKAMEDEQIVEQAAIAGRIIEERMTSLRAEHPSIGDVRGCGCFWGIELVRDRDTREMLVPFNANGEDLSPIAKMLAAARDRGLLLWAHWNVLAITPPLTVSTAEIDEAFEVMDEVLAPLDQHCD